MNPIRWFKNQETAVQALVGLATVGVIGFVVIMLIVAVVVGAAMLGAFALDLGSAAQLSQAANAGDHDARQMTATDRASTQTATATPASTTQPPWAPQVTFIFEETNNGIRITHDGGDALQANRVTLTTDDGTSLPWSADDGTISTGDSIFLSTSEDTTVHVIYEGPNGEAVLATYSSE